MLFSVVFLKTRQGKRTQFELTYFIFFEVQNSEHCIFPYQLPLQSEVTLLDAMSDSGSFYQRKVAKCCWKEYRRRTWPRQSAGANEDGRPIWTKDQFCNERHIPWRIRSTSSNHEVSYRLIFRLTYRKIWRCISAHWKNGESGSCKVGSLLVVNRSFVHIVGAWYLCVFCINIFRD